MKSINWDSIPPISYRIKAYSVLYGLMNEDHYGKDWTLSGLIKDDDTRKYICYQILDGRSIEGYREPETANYLRFKLRVLSRQACVRDKDGNRIWLKKEAKDYQGNPGDILPEHTDKPRTGDVVECKGSRKKVDPVTKKIVDASIKKKWARNGERECEYHEYVVDKDGCITVPFVQALQMLTKKGKKIAHPMFQKMDRYKDIASQRRLTNWWFEEVTE